MNKSIKKAIEKNKKQILSIYKKKFATFVDGPTGETRTGYIFGAWAHPESGTIYIRLRYKGKQMMRSVDSIALVEGTPDWFPEFEAAKKRRYEERMAILRAESQKQRKQWQLETHEAMKKAAIAKIGKNNENHVLRGGNMNNELNTI